MSDHVSDAFGGAADRACRRSSGTSGSGSTATGAISSVTRSPASAPAASRSVRSTFSQWPPCPSGSSVARKVKPLRVPSTDVMPREGSFVLASFGRVRKVHDSDFAAAFGRRSFAVKRILEAVLAIISFPPPNAGWLGLTGSVFERCATAAESSEKQCKREVVLKAKATPRRTLLLRGLRSSGTPHFTYEPSKATPPSGAVIRIVEVRILILIAHGILFMYLT